MPGIDDINARLKKYGLIIENGVLKKKGSATVSATKVAGATRIAATYLSRMAYIELLEKDLATIRSISRLTTPGAKEQARRMAREFLRNCAALANEIAGESKSALGTVIDPIKKAHDTVKQNKRRVTAMMSQTDQMNAQMFTLMAGILKALKDMQNSATENML